jgi:hypothetical protein
VQITLTTPLRRMILQLRHIFLTLASTFISFSSPARRAFDGAPRVTRRLLIPVL